MNKARNRFTSWLAGKPEETMLEVNNEALVPLMLPPEAFVTLQAGSFMPEWKWYSALYILQKEPTVKIGKFAEMLHVSYPTAKKIRERINIALSAS